MKMQPKLIPGVDILMKTASSDGSGFDLRDFLFIKSNRRKILGR